MAAVSVVLSATLRWAAQIVLPASYNPAAASADSRRTTIDNWDLAATLSGIVAILSKEYTIDGTGTFDIDLSAAPIIGAESSGVPAATESLAGKRMVGFMLQTPAANADDITVAPGASNGYELFGGSIADGIKLTPNDQWSRITQNASLPTVDASTRKIITVTGTEDDVIRVLMCFAAGS